MNEQLIEVLWQHDEPNVFITKEEYFAGFEGWQFETYEVNDRLAFIAMKRGPVFHFHSCGTGAKVPVNRMWQLFKGIADEHGYAETKTPIEDLRQQRFNRWAGFEETGRDEFYVIFRITRERCQQ